MTARTPKAPKASSQTATATETAEIRTAVADLNGSNRAEIIERIGLNAGAVRGGSASILADALTLCEGIKADDFAAVLTPEIASFRLGRVLTRTHASTLIKALRNDARVGGKIKGEDVASVLGISTGQVSTLNSLVIDADGNEADGPKPGDKVVTADGMIHDLIKALDKITARDDAKSEAAVAAWRVLEIKIRQALPSGTDTNNRGGKN